MGCQPGEQTFYHHRQGGCCPPNQSEVNTVQVLAVPQHCSLTLPGVSLDFGLEILVSHHMIYSQCFAFSAL